ncbi:hypothetical protein SAMN05192583_2301 [Sphingomonas gellani]|uniref:Uncharacterized protein n=1 Tax=Sphingomonas gellani TaxID=1166340 RepID=A0A1H8ETE5_9SPHN|nr:DUF1178 family protein [Sphingomonas gellani]SEN22753.1 hypothetical protein SAMN05192583_2301 [Sphingomonas gellani]
MIVFDLRCDAGHVFEAWFASSEGWESQRRDRQVRCPTCDSAEVEKALMTPAIGPKGNRRSGGSIDAGQLKQVMQAMAAAQGKMLEGSTWVGGGFAARARAMHDGDEPAAPIHGQASLAEAKALVDEGVPIAPLPLPVVPPDQVN